VYLAIARHPSLTLRVGIVITEDAMLALLVCVCLFQDEAQNKQAIKSATEIAQRFYAAYENGNVGGLIAISLVPFYFDGKSIINQQDHLQVEMKKLMDARDLSQGKRVPDVKLVSPYALMKDRMPAKDRALLDQVVRDDDFLVLVMLKPIDTSIKKSENVVLLARLKDGQAQVIGIKHTQ
jgi:hypothetical protein